MEYGCKRKTVVITGGTSGIGLAAARAFWLDGAAVSILGRDRVRGMKALAAIVGVADPEAAVFPGAAASGETFTAAEGLVLKQGTRDVSVANKIALARLRFIKADVTKQTDCRTAAVIAAHYGNNRIDILVNSAGIYEEKQIWQVTMADYNRIMDVNLKGTLMMIQACHPFLVPMGEAGTAEGPDGKRTPKEKPDRCIVNIASDAGIGGNYGCPVYCASKGAVVSLTKALALDLAPDVRVNCVCPGDVDTPMVAEQLKKADGGYTKEEMAAGYPAGRIARPEEIAHVICSIASPANTFMTGAVVPVDGGLTAIG